MIHLGDTDVEYHSGFQLYMTTPLANPHYLPETCIKVTLVNFTVTGPGLEEQLLAELVRKERPDLQASKDRLLLSISNDKRQLKVRTPPTPTPPPTPANPCLSPSGPCFRPMCDGGRSMEASSRHVMWHRLAIDRAK